MNGIVFLSLSVALQGNVALQSGIEFGWSQLPDNRVEYIIQLDDQAVDALKNGQPLTSSIPPEVQSADRIRIQYGTGALSKPFLSRKPQTGRTIADTPPALNVNELNGMRSDPLVGNGQVTVRNGNLNSVTNSTMGGARQTAYVTQETGTNSAIHWSNSNRVIGNFDNQNRRIANANSNPNNVQPNNPINNSAVGANGANLNLSNPNAGGTNGAASNLNNRTEFGQGNVNNSTFNNANVARPANQPNVGTNGMSPVNRSNANNSGWTSVRNPNRNNAVGNQGLLNPNTLGNPNNMANANAINGGGLNNNAMANPNLVNSGLPNNVGGGGFHNPQNYLPQRNPNMVAANGTPVGIPVTTAAPSNEVAELNKTIEEMKNQQRQRDHDEEIAKLKADQKAELEKMMTQFNEFKNKKESPAATPPAVQAKEDDSKRGNSSGIASVFLVISLGLNVFLVVQYLSVQNQFRDLSNDLRDTFMTNSYE